MTRHTDPWDSVDWAFIAQRLSDTITTMMHTENTTLNGTAFYAEALRRTIATSDSRVGLLPTGELERRTEQARHTARFNEQQAERARREHAEAVAEGHRMRRDALRTTGAQFAAALRRAAGRGPSKYRRDGVLLAATWLDAQPGPQTTDQPQATDRPTEHAEEMPQ